MLILLLDRLSRRLWPVTVRSATEEFGPPPAAKYPLLALYSDSELYRRDRDELLAEVKALHTTTRKAVVR